MTEQYWIDTRDKPGLLIAVMRELAGAAAEISFEGGLGESGLAAIPGASCEATAALRPCGAGDYLVLPLTGDSLAAIWKVVTEKEHLAYPSDIHHVQIAVDGRQVFGAYDNFHRDCVVAYQGFPIALLDRLVANGVIRSYETAQETEGQAQE